MIGLFKRVVIVGVIGVRDILVICLFFGCLKWVIRIILVFFCESLEMVGKICLMWVLFVILFVFIGMFRFI